MHSLEPIFFWSYILGDFKFVILFRFHVDYKVLAQINFPPISPMILCLQKEIQNVPKTTLFLIFNDLEIYQYQCFAKFKIKAALPGVVWLCKKSTTMNFTLKVKVKVSSQTRLQLHTYHGLLVLFEVLLEWCNEGKIAYGYIIALGRCAIQSLRKCWRSILLSLWCNHTMKCVTYTL